MFGCVLASTLAAILIARRLPEHHLNADSRDVVKLGLGLIGTLTALVVGLLVSTSKATFDSQTGTIKEVAAELALVDRVLARYGTDADGARQQIRALAKSVLDQMRPNDAAAVDFSGGESRSIGESLFEKVAQLEPKTDSQRLLKSRAQEIIVGLGQLRQRLVVNNERSIPTPLLVVLAVWQAVLFAGVGLLTPCNATALTMHLVCMASMSGAVFLIMELDRPFAGVIRVSDAPLRAVIAHLGE